MNASIQRLAALGGLIGGGLWACYGGSAADIEGGPGGSQGPGTSQTAEPNDPAPGDQGGGGGGGAGDGLPCDVDRVLAKSCRSCHGVQAGLSPLSTYADLTGPAKVDPQKKVAEVVIARMKNASSPMPPTGLLPASDVAPFEAWLAAGLPKGSCGADASVTDATDPYDTPVQCTSKRTWSGGESSTMAPGEACISCHKQRGGPSFYVAGTVYPTAHEPNDCNGVNGGVQVVITDANNKVTTLTVNSAGNFYASTRTAMAFPVHAKVTSSSGTRVMSGAITTGDCNSCHTVTGANNAPGRIMAP